METLQRIANRGSISTGYDIDNSLKLERANSEKLARTPSSASNSKTWTYSFWLKRTQLGINSYHLDAKGTGDKFFIFGFNENDQILFYDIFSDDYGKAFTRRFRDTSAWYHIVLRADTTDGTASNRMRLYVNGVQETAVTSDYGDFPQNHDTQINKAVVHNIGYRTDINQYASGYMAETCLIDGTSLAPDSFGEFDSDTGIWKPIDVSGLTFGTNGFYQDYKTGADLGADKVSGGNSNDYTETNIAAADQATDSPTNSFCIANAIAIGTSNLFQFTEGGTVCKRITADQWDFFTTTMPVNKGKWYGEFKAGGGPVMVGIGSLSYFEGTVQSSHTGAGMATNSGVAYYGADGKRWVDGTEAAYGATFGTSDIISIAMDLDNDNVYFAKNGTWQNSGDPTSGATGTGALSTDPVGDYFVMTMNMLYNPTTHFMNYGGYTTISISSAASDANGYGTFSYAVPTGYYALCSRNLSEFG
tara:strand:+ start:16 stop:1437 length:1422 start_codon:yes stop_codon:yes gene_type:complete